MIRPARPLLAPVLTLLSTLAPGACGPAPEPVVVSPAASATARIGADRAPPPIPQEPAAIARISDDVAYLASPALAGRGTGEPGARLAAEHVAKRFAILGLRPMGDAGPDGAPGWFQTFSARVGAKVAPPVVKYPPPTGKAKDTALEHGEAVTADGSATGDVRGEAVFVGHGITANAVGWDDYAGIKLAGKIAVVLSGIPKLDDRRGPSLRDFGATRYKIRTAREHEAAAIVIVAEGDLLPDAPVDASSMGIPAVVVRPSGAKLLVAAAKIDFGKARAATAPSKPASIDKTVLSVTTRIDPLEAQAVNVIGVLPAREGSPTAGEWVVVGAHFDHLGHGGTTASRWPDREIHPGADDNASGTAMLLDVARRLSSRKERPPRSVAFVAFGAEEIGVIGSRWFVDHPPFPIKSVSGMINADMVGRMRGRRLLVDGVGTSAGWAGLVRDASEGLGLSLTFGNEGFGASDHASFTAARVPVTFLFTGVHEDYHKPSDTADKVDAAGIERVATLASRLAVGVAERRERLAFVDAPVDPHRGGMRGGFRASLGTMPDYAFQGKGMRLSGVRADAPAARAGLKAGDVIVKVGAHAVSNVHDFMYALGELEPGREVPVEIERDGARVTVQVIPAPGR